MKLLLIAATSAFDVKAALLAGHAQHPVMVHFPIGLFIGSVAFDLFGMWQRQPALLAVAYYNLLAAALSLPLAIGTGLGAWRWQLEGAALKGNLRLHLIGALTSAVLILCLSWIRIYLRKKSRLPGISYWVITLLALLAITITGHLGGILSGVENAGI